MDRYYAVLMQLADKWLFSCAVFVAVFLAGVVVHFVGGWIVRRRAERLRPVERLLVEAFSRPLMLWALLLATWLAVEASPLSEHAVNLVGQGLLLAWIISLTLVAAGLATNLVTHFGSRIPGGLPTTSLTHNLVQGAVFILGGMLVLNLLGISIVPMLTALGVGGIAVALALQDTLANLFSGFYVGLAGNIRPGNYIKLSTGEEGYVTDIGWRATTLRTSANKLVIIPNATLAKATLTNYHLPDKRMPLAIPLSVHYASDMQLVESILLDEARRGADEISGLLAEPAPVVRFNPGFGQSTLDLTLIVHVAEFGDQAVVQDQIRRRIFARLRAISGETPFLVRNVPSPGPTPPAA